MRVQHVNTWRRLTAAATALMLVAATTGCLSTDSVRFQTAVPPKTEVSTRIVSVTMDDGHRFEYFQPPALESLELESPLLVGTAVGLEYGHAFANSTPIDTQNVAQFEIIVDGRRPFFSDPIQVGGAALVLALIASFLGGTDCTGMAQSSGRCSR